MSFAFGADALEWEPTWTALDQEHPSLVTSWQADRGRQFELDRTDGARATVAFADPDGILDPTNATGPYFGLIEPLTQVALCRRDPMADEWQPRFRGWVSDLSYDLHPSQRVNFLTVELVDLFEILGAIEMQPGEFGETLPPGDDSEGQIFFDNAQMGDRIRMVLEQALGLVAAPNYSVVFTGNVELWEQVYSAGETPMTVIQEAADGEFPAVANVYTDRHGRLNAHGRLAKFDPEAVLSTPGAERWDWHEWSAGDLAAVQATPGAVAQLRTFEFSRTVSKVINSALATPKNIADGDVKGQLVTDPLSIQKRGTRSWSALGLLTKRGFLGGSAATDALEETRKFASYYVQNYAAPRNRITRVGFRSILPGRIGSGYTWGLLSRVDVSDRIHLTLDAAGGGGFFEEPYYVEGVHEQVRPLNGSYDDVTVTLDLSPQGYFDYDPWAPL